MATAIHPTTGEEMTGYIASTSGFIIGRSGKPLNYHYRRKGISYTELCLCQFYGFGAANPAAVILATFDKLRPSKDHSVDHIDGDTRNNNLSNLRWATRSEQQNNTAKAVSRRRVPVICLETGESFDTAAEAGRKYGVSSAAIMSAIRNEHKCSDLHWAMSKAQLELGL